MSVTPMIARKGNGDGERAALREAILQAEEARDAAAKQEEAISRAKALVRTSEAKLDAATTAVGKF